MNEPEAQAQMDEPMSRADHLLMLEFGDRADWDDQRLEWRRLFSELLGTFLLVLAAAGGGILVGKGQIGLGGAVVAPGLTVLAIILFMGAISGAHLNPVVSLAFALRGDFPWLRVPGYIIVQLAGAVIAVAFASILRGAGGTAISRAAGSGVLDPGLFERRARLAADIEKGRWFRPASRSAISRATRLRPRTEVPTRRSPRTPKLLLPCKAATCRPSTGGTAALIPDASSYLSRSSTALDT
jgi:hypothetical protein